MFPSLKHITTIVRTDIHEAIRARWFIVYSLIFGGAIVILFSTGITESQVLGFTGLTRLLVTYIQLCIVILPIFVLIHTVRSIVGDRESHVMEYMLSMPIPLASYYWGKALSRLLTILSPVIAALLLSALWGLIRGLDVPWTTLFYYTGLLTTLTACFIGFSMFISTYVNRQEKALGIALLLWLGLLLFIDIILIGIMLQHRVQEQVLISIALLNPLQAFRTAAILLFDPEFSVIGPAANVIIDFFGKNGFLSYALIYPFCLGSLFALLGFMRFKKGDLV